MLKFPFFSASHLQQCLDFTSSGQVEEDEEEQGDVKPSVLTPPKAETQEETTSSGEVSTSSAPSCNKKTPNKIDNKITEEQSERLTFGRFEFFLNFFFNSSELVACVPVGRTSLSPPPKVNGMRVSQIFIRWNSCWPPSPMLTPSQLMFLFFFFLLVL